jgi:hypothetical protein
LLTLNNILDADLSVREFSVTFEAEVRLLSIELEVYDDDISEQDEKYILYTNYTTSSFDRCAIAVTIMDDDCKYLVIINTTVTMISIYFTCRDIFQL